MKFAGETVENTPFICAKPKTYGVLIFFARADSGLENVVKLWSPMGAESGDQNGGKLPGRLGSEDPRLMEISRNNQGDMEAGGERVLVCKPSKNSYGRRPFYGSISFWRELDKEEGSKSVSACLLRSTSLLYKVPWYAYEGNFIDEADVVARPIRFLP